jgi:hypothetical protein
MRQNYWLLFLYSTANLVGCLWGVIGLTAFFVIKQTIWLYLVPGLYLGGYLITPNAPINAGQWRNGNEISGQELKIQLEALIKRISKRVSPVELNKVIAIKEAILMLLPRLEEMNAGDYDLHIVKQTVTDYLPKMLMTYLELPPAFARMHKMRNGKTAQQILMEQLAILENQMNQIVISANRHDAESLIAQGEFLKSKFAEDADWL